MRSFPSWCESLSRRFRAIELEHNIAIIQDRIHVSNRAIGLDTADGYKLVEQAINELETPPQAIFIDTLSRHLMESEENSNDDMSRFISRLEEIRLKYQCTITLVHHTGKSAGQGARGASALRSNVDFSFEVEGKDKMCSLSCDKMKDADDAIPKMNFAIKAVDLGVTSSRGKPITGACVVKADRPFNLTASRKSNDEIALECFNEDPWIWQSAYVDSCTADIADDSKKRQFRKARADLTSEGKVAENSDGSYSLVQGD